ncbi:protocatechuate 3,4-dioxygenase subunit beta, partial [Streptomyces sp. NPDC002586]
MTLTQQDIDQEIAARHAAYEKRVADGAPVEHHPRRDYAPYRSSVLRHPQRAPVAIDTAQDPELVELHSPAFGERDITETDNDLTRHHRGEPVGERITVSGRLDGRGARWRAGGRGRRGGAAVHGA